MKSHVSLSCRFACSVALWALAVTTLPEALAGSLLVGDASYGVVRRYDSVTGASLGVFTSGGPLSSPQGLAYGPDGNLYVSDWDNQSVYRYNGTTGALLGVFATTSTFASELAFGPDGNLYVGLSSGAIQRFSGATGASLGIFTPAFPSSDFGGLTFHGGYLFVTYLGGAKGMLRQYNATTGALIATNYSGFSANGPRGPRFGPDGNLYIPDWQTPHVAKFDGATFAYLGNLIDDPSHPYPVALAFAADGSLLVLEDSGVNSSINRYNLSTGAFLSQLVAPGSGGLGRASCIILVPEPAQPPRLLVAGAQRVAGSEQLQLTWTNNGVACVLEHAGAVTGSWSTVSTPWVTNANWVSTTVTNTSSAQFYRLRSN